MNKKATILPMYLLFLTVVICGASIFLHIIQERNIQNSVVSPVDLLRLQDNQERFEMQEKVFIIKTGQTALKENYVWGSKDFENRIHDKIAAELLLYKDMSNFIFTDLASKDGQKILDESIDSNSKKQGFLNKIYSVKFSGDSLIVSRAEIGKSFKLEAPELSKINFPIFIKYFYSKEYSFKKEDFEK